jgi:NAD(P)-dependent dehydrogenase (short-subunit alcohol dehydrogenase family)
MAGHTAIVTGANHGIGAAAAAALAQRGCGVLCAFLRVEDPADPGTLQAYRDHRAHDAGPVVAQIQAAGGRAVAVEADLADPAAPALLFDAAEEQLGPVDILVNNAGIIRDRMLVNMDEAEWDAVINVHLKGHFAPTRHAAAYWRERSKAGDTVRARVICTSSPSGVFGNVGQANYGAAKGGIAAFTLIVAQELGRYGVTVNCIAPNARTRMTEQAFGDMAAPEGGFDAMDPANMAPVVVALCADEAQDITGQVLFVYGGSVNVLRGWSPGELIARDSRWDADELLAELRVRFPSGAQPAGMIEAMMGAGGQSQSAAS